MSEQAEVTFWPLNYPSTWFHFRQKVKPLPQNPLAVEPSDQLPVQAVDWGAVGPLQSDTCGHGLGGHQVALPCPPLLPQQRWFNLGQKTKDEASPVNANCQENLSPSTFPPSLISHVFSPRWAQSDSGVPSAADPRQPHSGSTAIRAMSFKDYKKW